MGRAATRSEVIAAVEQIGAAAPDRTLFVGIDGFGASGKSALAEAVAAAVPRAEVVHVDDFSGPDVPEWDWSRFRSQLVLPLLAGRAGRYQAWHWTADAGGDWRTVPPGRVVIVEGVSSTRQAAGVDWALTVWVQAPPEVRRARAIARDGNQVWRTRWEGDWLPLERAYARRERPSSRSDLIVDGTA